MKYELKSFQREAVDAIVECVKRKTHIAGIQIPAGTGKSVILIAAIERLINEQGIKNVLLIFDRRVIVEQFAGRCREILNREISTRIEHNGNHNITILTSKDMLLNKDMLLKQSFDLVVLDDAQVKCANTYGFIKEVDNGCLLGVFSSINSLKDNLFFGSSIIYRIAIENVIYAPREKEFIQQAIVPILTHDGFEKINTDWIISRTSMVRPDIVAEKQGKSYAFEVKMYREQFPDGVLINNAIQDVAHYYKTHLKVENQVITFVAIFLCDVNQKIKEELYQKERIVLWDIKDLLYICGNNLELLSKLAFATPYSINGISGTTPIDDFKLENNAEWEKQNDEARELMRSLEECDTGKEHGADREYEMICESILKYLFPAEFSQFSNQHQTNDEMFRMDILCGLKGTTAFWKFLIRYYNTKFVVFECKNYNQKIKQNLIYITEKYLYSAALRNVAFIISRHGFDDHAVLAACGVLKEHMKLIISVDDDDLKNMIGMKMEGLEPSDYLLDKVERFLMDIGK